MLFKSTIIYTIPLPERGCDKPERLILEALVECSKNCSGVLTFLDLESAVGFCKEALLHFKASATPDLWTHTPPDGVKSYLADGRRMEARLTGGHSFRVVGNVVFIDLGVEVRRTGFGADTRETPPPTPWQKGNDVTKAIWITPHFVALQCP